MDRLAARIPTPPMAWLCACLLLAACGPREAAQPAAPATSPATSPAPATQSAPAQAAPTPAQAAPALAKPPYRFAFASKHDKRNKDPRVVDWGEDGCGPYPVAEVEAIPLHDAWLLPDWVVEFDDKNREIARWGRPMAAELVGLDGPRLRFRVDGHGQTGEFATDADGALQPLSASGASLYDSARQIECPRLPTFAESDYAQCFVVKDAAGAERRLAWEAPCT
ncbi:hypothetical protein [Lysobacter enzymogenes]|uniref:hypothetical protein n=1 Tax=Lysobacter enzymogenes TaxID=69 RepID=UPI0011160D08|nr:hypothetical protein [Lysobacter enzymogenes]UZW63224.1 hypothetical protein BV903_013455 [Lysobacter enzymogenes]